MIIITAVNGTQFFAASRKSVPGLIQEVSGDSGLEDWVSNCTYFEFNTRENRTGKIGPGRPLSDLVTIACGLRQEETEDAE